MTDGTPCCLRFYFCCDTHPRRLPSFPTRRSSDLARTAHFLENHDEPRIASLLDFEEHRAASLLTLALPGMRQGERSEEHTSELQSPYDLVCRLLLEKTKQLLSTVRTVYQHCTASL